MTDIVERLRGTTEQMACTSSVDMALWDKHSNACLEAADEIERLRQTQEPLGMFFIKIGDRGYYVCEAVWREFETLRETKAPYRDGFSDGVHHERQRISYENERLREALKPFAYYAEQIPNDVSNTASASGTVGDLRAAKAALEEK